MDFDWYLFPLYVPKLTSNNYMFTQIVTVNIHGMNILIKIISVDFYELIKSS